MGGGKPEVESDHRWRRRLVVVVVDANSATPGNHSWFGLKNFCVSYIEFSQEESLARMLFGYSLLLVVVETALLMEISVSTDSFPSCSSVTMVNW